MRMVPSTPPSTHRWHSSRPRPQLRLTSTSCRTHSCNHACKMATRATARRRSRTPSIKHNQSYLRRGLGKGVWGDHLDRTRVGRQPRDRKHLNKGHTPAIKVPSMVARSSKELRHIRHPSSTRAAMLAFLHRRRTSSSIHKVYPSACPPCPRPRFRQRFKTLALVHRPRIRNKEVESIPLKMGLHHMCTVCHMAAAQTNPLIHRLPPITRPLLRLNTAKARSPFNSSSSISSNNNNNACMRCDSSS